MKWTTHTIIFFFVFVNLSSSISATPQTEFHLLRQFASLVLNGIFEWWVPACKSYGREDTNNVPWNWTFFWRGALFNVPIFRTAVKTFGLTGMYMRSTCHRSAQAGTQSHVGPLRTKFCLRRSRVNLVCFASSLRSCRRKGVLGRRAFQAWLLLLCVASLGSASPRVKTKKKKKKT